MGWGDLRNKLVKEVQDQGGDAIQIKSNTVLKQNTKTNSSRRLDEERRQYLIETYTNQVYRKDDRFFDNHNDFIYETFLYLKDILWRNGINFKNERNSYINFYDYAKQTSSEYKFYADEEKSELALAGLIDIDASESEEFTTPSDEYNRIANIY